MAETDEATDRLPPTRAFVNARAIESNTRALRSVSQAANLMAVVKADAYGHGAVAAALAALQGGATWIGTYSIEEALPLRRSGITAPILAFRPALPGEGELFARHRVVPTITSRDVAQELNRAAAGTRLAYHIKVDTGMHRSGVAPSEVFPLVETLGGCPNLVFQGLYTHFSSADEGTVEPTKSQFRTLMDVLSTLRSAGFDPELVHAANSAAILDFPETHGSMVRAGIALYGYHPSDRVRHRVGLVPALRVASRLIRTHWLRPGDPVGYGAEFHSPDRRLIGLVPIGYGHGMPRSLGNGAGSLLFRGHPVPIIGRVSMDQVTVDLAATPDARAGEDVVWIGTLGNAEQTAEDVAAAAGTISYEILTRISARVPRIVVHGPNEMNGV
ncbi:MAG TPA: alanine racemase [Chloroflexota bacterium]|nr:alanine racemase [Chloroflexota bacterium]